jgi:hypothetical protein
MKVGPSTDLKKLSDEKYYFGFRIIPPIWRQSKIIMGIKTFFCHVAFSNSNLQKWKKTTFTNSRIQCLKKWKKINFIMLKWSKHGKNTKVLVSNVCSDAMWQAFGSEELHANVVELWRMYFLVKGFVVLWMNEFETEVVFLDFVMWQPCQKEQHWI